MVGRFVHPNVLMRFRFDLSSHYTIFHLVDCVKDIEGSVIVRDDNDACPPLMGYPCKKLHYLPTSVTVEGGSRFVCQNHARMVRQCTSDGDPLLLAAREHGWQVVTPISDAKIIQQFHRPFPSGTGRLAVEFESDLHVFSSGQERDQIRLLENEPKVAAAKGSEVGLAMGTIKDQPTTDQDLPGGRRVDEADCGEERRFP